jgi:hypothetical protein
LEDDDEDEDDADDDAADAAAAVADDEADSVLDPKVNSSRVPVLVLDELDVEDDPAVVAVATAAGAVLLVLVDELDGGAWLVAVDSGGSGSSWAVS